MGSLLRRFWKSWLNTIAPEPFIRLERIRCLMKKKRSAYTNGVRRVHNIQSRITSLLDEKLLQHVTNATSSFKDSHLTFHVFASHLFCQLYSTYTTPLSWILIIIIIRCRFPLCVRKIFILIIMAVINENISLMQTTFSTTKEVFNSSLFFIFFLLQPHHQPSSYVLAEI